MSIVNINKKNFEKEIGKLDEKMLDRIAMFGTPVEEFKEEDDEFQIEVFPNRPDLLSYHGFKRSFLAFLNKKTGMKYYKINKPEKNFKVTIDSSVKTIRPFTACAIVKGLKFDDEKIKEIIEIQEKIHLTVGRKRKKLAIGIYPLEKIKLPITFKALEPDKIRFIPLESEREMSGLEILQRHPTGKDYAHLLAGKTKFPVFVDAENKVLSMPPIINSKETGKITEKTKDVFIECSGFEMETLKKCLNILVSILSDMGGKIYQMEIYNSGKKETTPDFETEKIKISIEKTNKLLGLNLNEKQIKKLLEKAGYNYKKGKVEIPPWRMDILHEVDLIEDVAITYGYENFIPEITPVATIGQEDEKETVKRKISQILTGLGFLEISNYHLSKKQDQFNKMGIPEKIQNGFVEIKDSKTEFGILRKDLTHYTLKIISENVDSEYPQDIFEIGKVFEEENSKITEKENLCIAKIPGNYTEMKQVLEYLERMSGKKIEITKTENAPEWFIEGRVTEIKINEKTIGFMGEIHPRILKNWKIKMPVSLTEINLKELI